MPKAKYPPRKCLNPKCPIGTFTPMRSDAKYCDNVCRSNAHFNFHKEENKSKYKIIQQQKQSEKKLQEIYLACQQQKIEFVTSEILELHKIDVFSAPETGTDQKTKNKIFWFFEYGVMGVAFEKFKIIKKSDYGRLHSV